nr:NAD(P)-dependent oxidoreductase [Desulforamulus reducens]
MGVKKRVLVTGASGFIGTHLVSRLCKENMQVGVLRKSKLVGTLKNDHEEFLQANILDYDQMKAVVQYFQPEIVCHLAGLRPNGHSWRDVLQAYEINLLGTMNLLRSLQGVNCQSVILVGSVAEYGRGPTPYREHQALYPTSAYGTAKAAATALGCLCYNYFKLPVVTLRLALVYGPGQGEQFFLSQLIKSLLLEQPFAMTGGEQYRDFIHVNDVVEALWLAANTPRARGGILNIGMGQSYPLKEVAMTVATSLGRTELLRIGERPYAQGEQFAYCVDTQLARQVLNWQPKVSLEKGIMDTISWYQGTLL